MNRNYIATHLRDFLALSSHPDAFNRDGTEVLPDEPWLIVVQDKELRLLTMADFKLEEALMGWTLVYNLGEQKTMYLPCTDRDQLSKVTRAFADALTRMEQGNIRYRALE